MTLTTERARKEGKWQPITKITWAFETDEDGDASEVTAVAQHGALVRVVTVPDGDDTPSQNWDLTITDEHEIDLLGGTGLNRDAGDTGATEEIIIRDARAISDKLTFTVANGGDAKKGVVTAYLEEGVNPSPVSSSFESDVEADITAAKAEVLEALTATTGSGTLNDANTSDTIVPTTRPCKTELVLDISALNNASDDFTLDVKVGASGSEKMVAWFNLTSDGTDITCDTGSGVGFVIEQRRLNIMDITVLANEQMIITRTKNGSTDRNVPYAYVNRA